METHAWAADGTEQQAEISRIASEDAFNWGYDPVHYGVPEGSYSTDPDDGSRIVEYRYMVKVLPRLPAAACAAASFILQPACPRYCSCAGPEGSSRLRG